MCLIAAVAAAASCSGSLDVPHHGREDGFNMTGDPLSRNPNEVTNKTLLLYSAGYNNLSSALQDDIEDMTGDYVPTGNNWRADNMFIFAHHSVTDSDYETTVAPSLIRVYRDRKDNIVRDTVARWPEGTSAVDPKTLTEVLEYIKTHYASREYGMIFSSHASGWLPPGFSLFTRTGRPDRSIGADYGTDAEMDIKDFAAAIPFKLDYIIFDACLTGGIEVAYELKDVCDYLVFSSEEILADGMVYTDIATRLLASEPTDLQGVCEDYYNHYNSQSGQYRSATVSLVDCSRLENLAAVCSGIFGTHLGQLPAINPSEVQIMRSCFRWFYDFRDIFRQLPLSGETEAALDEALSVCVIYKASTEYFIDTKISTFCGLSMYLPGAVMSESTRKTLNTYYKGFKWNMATGYIPENMDIY